MMTVTRSASWVQRSALIRGRTITRLDRRYISRARRPVLRRLDKPPTRSTGPPSPAHSHRQERTTLVPPVDVDVQRKSATLGAEDALRSRTHHLTNPGRIRDLGLAAAQSLACAASTKITFGQSSKPIRSATSQPCSSDMALVVVASARLFCRDSAAGWWCGYCCGRRAAAWGSGGAAGRGCPAQVGSRRRNSRAAIPATAAV